MWLFCQPIVSHQRRWRAVLSGAPIVAPMLLTVCGELSPEIEVVSHWKPSLLILVVFETDTRVGDKITPTLTLLFTSPVVVCLAEMLAVLSVVL